MSRLRTLLVALTFLAGPAGAQPEATPEPEPRKKKRFARFARFILGLGVSGPQVVEGLHGVAFERPLGRLREAAEPMEAGLEAYSAQEKWQHAAIAAGNASRMPKKPNS